ncbi:MAG: GNAT family N-acetyltransferase [Candidatus Cloacimonetes bacterium]|nr:GNAT family N-acetyltransferase [Candidatus Cloacimonadota bacterium]
MLNLITKRLIIKSHTLENLEKINEWFNDKELLYFEDDQEDIINPVTLDETQKFLENIINSQSDIKVINYAIHRKLETQLIGHGKITCIDYYNKRCKISITIGNKKNWGKGYAKETLIAIIEYCFKNLKLNRIGAEIFSFNKRSISLFESLNFNREGIIHQYVFKKGRFFDEYRYGLLISDWEKKKNHENLEGYRSFKNLYYKGGDLMITKNNSP